MASYKKIPGSPDFEPEDGGTDNGAAPYVWFADQAAVAQPQSANAPESQVAESNTEASTNAPEAAPAMSAVPGQAAVTGTPNADVFPLDIGTLTAAVAPTPALAQISGYSAAQGDVVDFSAILRGSYAPMTADSAQLRVTADTSGAFATLDFNVGTAQNPHWTALAKLDGVHVGDAVNVALDAAHTVQLHAAWLA
jgi:hypothetical protein